MIVLATSLEYLKARYNFGSAEGATAVEYGIMVALIAIAIIFAVVALGDTLETVFTDVETTLDQNT